MDPAFVKAKLIEILETIQRDSGRDPVSFTGDTCPLSELPGFDSKIWPVAIALLAAATGITIPNRQNIFLSADGRQRLTIDQIVVEVCKIAPKVA